MAKSYKEMDNREKFLLLGELADAIIERNDSIVEKIGGEIARNPKVFNSEWDGKYSELDDVEETLMIEGKNFIEYGSFDEDAVKAAREKINKMLLKAKGYAVEPQGKGGAVASLGQAVDALRMGNFEAAKEFARDLSGKAIVDELSFSWEKGQPFQNFVDLSTSIERRRAALEAGFQAAVDAILGLQAGKDDKAVVDKVVRAYNSFVELQEEAQEEAQDQPAKEDVQEGDQLSASEEVAEREIPVEKKAPAPQDEQEEREEVAEFGLERAWEEDQESQGEGEGEEEERERRRDPYEREDWEYAEKFFENKGMGKE